MAECKCTEITRLDEDIKTLDNLKKLMFSNTFAVNIVENNIKPLSSQTHNAFVSDTKGILGLNIGKMDDYLDEKINNVLSKIDEKMDLLEEERDGLDAEDKQYHDDLEKQSEENMIQEEM